MNDETKEAKATAPTPEDALAEKRLELQRRKATREKIRAAVDAEREVQVLELEDRFENEIGPRGKMFEIVETVEGPIVIKLGEPVLFQKFTASKVTDVDVHNFVYPCVVFPAKEEYLKITAPRPELAGRCAHALMNLYGAKHKDDTGKF